VWSEFDEVGEGYLNITNLRPLIDRLGARKHPVGFSTASDMNRFKAIWARVMSNPKFFTTDIKVEEGEREQLGLSFISRDNIIKAYGEGSRSRKIRDYLYSKIDWGSKFGKGFELEFKYTANVLCIFRDGIRNANTTSDLINIGTAKQMLVAMQFLGGDSEVGGNEQVPGRDGGENRRWAALAIHNSLQLQRGAVDGNKEGGKAHKPGPGQLPKILKALGLMSKELRPPIIDPLEPPAKPTGEKMAEILGKTKKMQAAFDQIIDRLVEDILWGSEENEERQCTGQVVDPHDSRVNKACGKRNAPSATECLSCGATLEPYLPSVLGIKLDMIIKQAVDDFASRNVNALMSRLKPPCPKQLRYSTLASSMQARGEVPQVRSAPRGWLASGKLSAAMRRERVPEAAVDRTAHTIENLKQLAPHWTMRRGGAAAHASSSLAPHDVSRGCTQSVRPTPFTERVRKMTHDMYWQNMFLSHFGMPSQGLTSEAAADDVEAGTSPRRTQNYTTWKTIYSRRLSQRPAMEYAAGSGSPGDDGQEEMNEDWFQSWINLKKIKVLLP
jgi:hypothetical protein